MTLGAEAALVLLALALYVHDASLLLRSDEFIVTSGRHGRLHPSFGAHGWKLRGREPWVPNLLAPWQGLVRVRWSFEQGLEGAAGTGSGGLPDVGWLPRAGVTVLMLLVFGALPACLFARAPAEVTVSVMAAIYATCVGVLLMLRPVCRRFGFPPSAFWKLAVECTACPPFCINAVRRVTLRAGGQVTVQDVAGANGAEALRPHLYRRVLEQIDLEPEGTPRMARLQSVAARLVPSGADD